VHTPNTPFPGQLTQAHTFAVAGDAGGHVLLQGSVTQNQPASQRLHSTFRYDGVDWQPVPTAHQPTGWYGGLLVQDGVQNHHVWYSGRATWEFDGVDWREVDARLLPEARFSPTVLADPARRRLLMFGGHREGIGATSDLLAWTGTQWQLVPTAATPPARREPVVAFDTHRDRVVMHGGATPAVTYTDTWEFDGATWTQRVTANTPWPLPTAMAFDPVRARCIAYGGLANPPHAVSNTWSYDGEDWTQVATVHRAPPRNRPAFAYDTAHDAMVLYGGHGNATNAVHTDTWWLRDGDWQQQDPQVRPPAAYTIGGYDQTRGRLVIATGDPVGGPGTSGFHEYDGQLWSALPTAAAPPTRISQRLVLQFEPVRGQLLAVGAWGEVWAYEPTPVATFATLGAGCAAGASPRLDAAPGSTPQLGGAFTVQLHGLAAAPGAVFVAYGFGQASWLGRALPQDLGWLGLPGCLLWLEPAGLGELVVHAGGRAALTLALPANGALAGTRFLLQGLPLDALTPLGLGAPTNAGVAIAH
jgi:hypothetical protein